MITVGYFVKGMLPIIISLDSTVFKPGVHTITIIATSTSGDVATYSENFIIPGNHY
jgi:hypothetical protein